MWHTGTVTRDTPLHSERSGTLGVLLHQQVNCQRIARKGGREVCDVFLLVHLKMVFNCAECCWSVKRPGGGCDWSVSSTAGTGGLLRDQLRQALLPAQSGRCPWQGQDSGVELWVCCSCRESLNCPLNLVCHTHCHTYCPSPSLPLVQVSSAHGQLQRSIPSLMARLEVKNKRISDLEGQVKASKEAQRKDYEK